MLRRSILADSDDKMLTFDLYQHSYISIIFKDGVWLSLLFAFLKNYVIYIHKVNAKSLPKLYHFLP